MQKYVVTFVFLVIFVGFWEQYRKRRIRELKLLKSASFYTTYQFITQLFRPILDQYKETMIQGYSHQYEKRKCKI